MSTKTSMSPAFHRRPFKTKKSPGLKPCETANQMANLCQPLPALLLFCFVASLFLFTHSASVSFNFPPVTDIGTEHDAEYEEDHEGGMLQLTKNEALERLDSSYGWAFYNQAIPLWERSSGALANFSTHFQFVVEMSDNTDDNHGDGLAFFLTPFELEPPENASGEGFGLFNEETYKGSPYPMVAVEFDTFKNEMDPDNNHVGIDINSIFSNLTVSLNNSRLFNTSCYPYLINGKPWDAWVDYDGVEKSLRVFLSCNPNNTTVSKPKSPLFTYTIDLRNYLPESIKVGLSASTGALTETHTVRVWNFSSNHSWEVRASVDGITKHDRKRFIVHVFLICVLFVVVVLCGFIIVRWLQYFRKSKREGKARDESDLELDKWCSNGPRSFSYAELRAATGNFGEKEKLGHGGFGSVYKGILPGTGETVAVKRIAQGSRQGRKEYVSEIQTISRLRHRNLMRLLGWCHQKGELLLVYEYLPNGSLDKHIFGKEKDTLKWDRRYSIACDIASALVYLHEEWDQRVVHRDVKASNVMLDSDFNAKLGDFGLARLMERDQAASHTTVVAGTRGYVAPECYITGKTSPEADVYSFGAVTLEIACGRRPVDHCFEEHNCRLVEWVWDLYGKGDVLDAVDEKLGGDFNAEEMERLIVVGLLCSNLDSTSRPKMREVIKILKNEVGLPYVPSDLPVAVYSQRNPLKTSSGLSSSGVLFFPGVLEPVMSSSSPVLSAPALLSCDCK